LIIKSSASQASASSIMRLFPHVTLAIPQTACLVWQQGMHCLPGRGSHFECWRCI
jgi:hypothetical protein